MANVFDVAKYIVDKVGEIDVWKLQKLIYYCQAWSLAWDGSPLFDDIIEAWANGPVCPTLRSRHEDMYVVDKTTPIWHDANPDALTSGERETIDVVLRDYNEMPNYELRELTHLEEPWNKAREGVPLMEPCTNEITPVMMRLYYGSL